MKTQRVPKRYRNHGGSFGLEYPYVYGEIALGGKPTWAVWHRHTGIVAHEVRMNPQLDRCLHEYEAQKKCLELNGNPAPYIAENDSIG